MTRILLIAAIALSVGVPGQALAWKVIPQDLSATTGCFAAKPNGDRIACVRYIAGRLRIEAKRVKDRRIYKTAVLGTDAEPFAVQKSSKDLKELDRWLHARGYKALTAGVARPDGTFTVPGSSCRLLMSDDSTLIQTTAGEARSKPWLLTGGPGGKAKLASVTVHEASGQLFISLIHEVEVAPEPPDESEIEGDAEKAPAETGPVRADQLKVMALSDLLARSECRPSAAPTD